MKKVHTITKVQLLKNVTQVKKWRVVSPAGQLVKTVKQTTRIRQLRKKTVYQVGWRNGQRRGEDQHAVVKTTSVALGVSRKTVTRFAGGRGSK